MGLQMPPHSSLANSLQVALFLCGALSGWCVAVQGPLTGKGTETAGHLRAGLEIYPQGGAVRDEGETEEAS